MILDYAHSEVKPLPKLRLYDFLKKSVLLAYHASSIMLVLLYCFFYTALVDCLFPCYPLFENDPNLKSLRKDERFITFMAQMKRQWERYNATL